MDEVNAAHFMIKRYPPVCGVNYTETTKPLFVQLMLVDRDGGEYHRSLLNAMYDQRGQLKMRLLKSSTDIDDSCSSVWNPSVQPGTLFMLNYG